MGNVPSQLKTYTLQLYDIKWAMSNLSIILLWVSYYSFTQLVGQYYPNVTQLRWGSHFQAEYQSIIGLCTITHIGYPHYPYFTQHYRTMWPYDPESSTLSDYGMAR